MGEHPNRTPVMYVPDMNVASFHTGKSTQAHRACGEANILINPSEDTRQPCNERCCLLLLLSALSALRPSE